MIAKCGTGTTFTSTSTDSGTAATYVVVYADDGWREVTVDDLAAIQIKEPAQEQDEPDTEPTTFFPRRYVNRESEPRRRPRQRASGYG